MRQSGSRSHRHPGRPWQHNGTECSLYVLPLQFCIPSITERKEVGCPQSAYSFHMFKVLRRLQMPGIDSNEHLQILGSIL